MVAAVVITVGGQQIEDRPAEALAGGRRGLPETVERMKSEGKYSER